MDICARIVQSPFVGVPFGDMRVSVPPKLEEHNSLRPSQLVLKTRRSIFDG